jgi:hypothetical protein
MFSHTGSIRVYGSFPVTGNPNRSGLVPVLCMIGLNSWSSASQDEYEHQHRLRIIVSGTNNRGVYQWQMASLISSRSVVRIHSPQPTKRVDRTRGVQRPSKPIMRSSTLPTRSRTFRVATDSATRMMRSGLATTGGPSLT